MNLSNKGEDFIKQWERLETTCYYDESGYQTGGWGHKFSKAERPVFQVSREKADLYFKDDVAIVEKCLNTNFPQTSEGEDFFNQNQFDALVAFVFNIGTKAFLNSHVYAFLYNNMRPAACEWWEKWCHDRNPVTHEEETSQGLVNRRAAEVKLFNTGEYA